MTTERSQAALAEFQRMRPTLELIAQGVTRNSKIRIRLTDQGPHTDGRSIFLPVPPALGAAVPHTKRVCFKRDEVTGEMLCPECARRDLMLGMLSHEVGHLGYGTFEVARRSHATAHRAAVDAAWWATDAVKQQARDAFKRCIDRNAGYKDSILPLGSFMPMFLNVTEDMRVERAITEAKPGAGEAISQMRRKMFFTKVGETTEITGEVFNGWRTGPLNAQVMLALIWVYGSPLEVDDQLDPTILEHVRRPQIRRLCREIIASRSIMEASKSTVALYGELIKLGYFEQPTAPEPEADETEGESDDDDGLNKETEGERSDQADTPDEEKHDDQETPARGEQGDQSSGSETGDSAGGEADSEDGSGGGPDDASRGGSEQRDPGARPDGEGTGDGQPEGGVGNPADAGEGDASPRGDVHDADGGNEGGHQDQADAGDAELSQRDDGNGGNAGAGGPGSRGSAPSGDGGAGGGSESDAPEQGRAAERGQDGGGDRPSHDGAQAGDPGGESGSGSDASGLGTAVSDGSDADAEKSSWEVAHRDARLPDDAADGERDDRSDPQRADEAGTAGSDGRGADGADGSTGGASEPDAGADPGRGHLADGVPENPRVPPDGHTPFYGGTSVTPGGGWDPAADVAYGAADEIEGLLEETLGHGHGDHVDGTEDKTELTKSEVTELIAIDEKPIEFSAPSTNYGETSFYDYEPDRARWVVRGDTGYKRIMDSRGYTTVEQMAPRDRIAKLAPDGLILTEATQRLRLALQENRRSAQQRNLKAGKINPTVLGKRAAQGDPRLFRKKIIPGKRDYHVVVQIDCSGSTAGGNLYEEKRAVFAQAEMMQRLGISFEIFGTSGDYNAEHKYSLLVFGVKEPNEPWDAAAKERLAALPSAQANLDGHAMDFCRHRALQSNASDRIIMYYSDGAMPAENYVEELRVLKASIKSAQVRGVVVIGVGVNTDSPSAHGLPTVRVDSDSDLPKVVKHLGAHIRT